MAEWLNPAKGKKNKNSNKWADGAITNPWPLAPHVCSAGPSRLLCFSPQHSHCPFSSCSCHPISTVLLMAAFLSLSFFTSITTRLLPQTVNCRCSSLLPGCYQTQILSPLASNIWHCWDSPLITENIQKCSRVSYSSLWLRFSVASFSLHPLNAGVLQTLGPELLTGLSTLNGTYLLPQIDDLKIDNSSLPLSLQGLLCASSCLWDLPHMDIFPT